MVQTIKQHVKKIASGLAAGVLLFSQLAVVPSVGATTSDKVDICHATDSHTNPYTKNDVNKSSVDEQNNQYLNGHGDHTGPVWQLGIADHSWGDIIPPFTYANTNYPGQNWTATGQAIYYNKCTPPAKGSLKIVKDAQPDSQDDFDFFVKKGIVSIDSFELEDDGNNLDGQKNFDVTGNLTAGTYTVYEDPDQPTWMLSQVTCDNANYWPDLANKKLTVDVAAGQNVTCTFVNTPTPTYGKVHVSKKLDANGDGHYGDANGAGFPFRWGLDNEPVDNLMGNTQLNVPTGAHTVTENTVNGYEFAGWYYTALEDNVGLHQINCKHPQGTTLPVPVTVEKNKTKEVTFCNKVKKSSITIIKDAQPNSVQDFDFTIDQKGIGGLYHNFELEDDGDNNDGQKNYKTYENLKADEYIVTEHGEFGWALKDITCSEGANVIFYKEDGKVVIKLAQGQNVTCTFVNQKKGKIKVFKHTTPKHDQTNFAIEIEGTGKVYSDPTRLIADGEYEEFWVGHGTFSVNETLPAGWVQSDTTCEDIVINVENLYTECHIYNTKEAKLTIVKEAYPENGDDFMFTTNKLGDFTLDVDDDATYEDSQQFIGLEAGEYTVSELASANWQQVYVYCHGTEDYNVWEGGTLAVDLKAGDDVTCYFVNVKQNTITGHKFNDVNGNHVWDEGESALEGWTITLTQECVVEHEVRNLLAVTEQEVVEDCEPIEDSTVTDENGAYAFTNLEPGTYTVCEIQKTNWMQTYPQANNGCHEIVIEGPGEVVVADFGNKAKPQVLGESTTKPKTLVKTGASTSKSLLIGLTILSALGAVHVLTHRRKDYVAAK